MSESLESENTDSWLDNPKVREILCKNLDETDYRIYEALNENGRISDTELGERVGLSRTAARRRRKDLQEEGIIDVLGVLVLQEAELAYADVRITFSTDAVREDIDAFVQGLVEDELVYEVDEYLGTYDLLVRIWHESLNELKNYVRDRVQGESVVKSYETVPVTRTHKAWHKIVKAPE
jgi:Lrp/AsnC family leucine-responsive transcriptional regulator